MELPTPPLCIRTPPINVDTSASVPRAMSGQLSNLVDGRDSTIGQLPAGTMPYVTLDMGVVTGRIWAVRLISVGDASDLSPSHGLSVFLSDSATDPTQVLCRRGITFMQAKERIDVSCPFVPNPVRYVTVQKVGLGPVLLGLAEVQPLIFRKSSGWVMGACALLSNASRIASTCMHHLTAVHGHAIRDLCTCAPSGTAITATSLRLQSRVQHACVLAVCTWPTSFCIKGRNPCSCDCTSHTPVRQPATCAVVVQ